MKKVHYLFLIVVLCLYSHSFGSDHQWRRLFNKSVTLFCYHEDMRHGEKMIGMINEVLPELTEWYGLSENPKITVLVTPSQKVFDRMTGEQIPEWGVAAADPNQSVVFLKSPRIARPESNLEKIIIHELSHIILYNLSGGAQIDRWFDEGLAMMLSGERGLRETLVLARAVTTGNIIWLDEIDNVLTFQRQKADLAYHESLSAVQFLKKQYGNDVFHQIMDQLHRGRDMGTAMQAVIGLKFGEFEENWYQAMRIKYRWAFLLNFPLMLSIFMVLLFLAAFVATKKRIHRKRKTWEQEEYNDFETAEDYSVPD